MIDLRSDTVTRPCSAMRGAMAHAEVGDDVLGDDPTVRRLEELSAEMLGKEAALFTPSSTQSNLIALLTHCGRGDEAIVGQEAHNYLFEAGGSAVLGGIQPQPVIQETDGTLDLGTVKSHIKPDDFHFARTRLLCLENTTWGKILPEGYAERARKLADENGLSMHLDGARIFNAAVGSNTSAAELASPFDSISVCLSKGLGAPVGSVLVGSHDFLKEGKRWRKMLGGGMRQSGILAAAGIYAFENNIERLAEDHANAARLGDGLSSINGINVDPVQTNMVFVDFENEKPGLSEFLKSKGILVGGYGGGKLRIVLHLDVSESDVDSVVAAIQEFRD
ncbi:UNVERIFIED_CONTAM: hypothetical protein GTU68_024781 [Idotea baltica]|nr:hypothetical protein [Idotea baltica]